MRPNRITSLWYRALLVCLLPVVAPPVAANAGQGDDHPTVAALLARGDACYRALDNVGALKAYGEAEELEPENFEVLVRLTRVYNDMGRQLLRKSPDAEGYYRNAIGYAERLRTLRPERAETWFFLALCHGSLVPFKSLGERLELSRDVRANAEHALEIDSTFAMSYVILGIYYRGVARLSWLERTLVNGILGKNLEGTLEDSERMLNKALALDSASPFVHYELARTYRAMDRPSDAIAALRNVIALPVANAREAQQREDAKREIERLLAPDRN